MEYHLKCLQCWLRQGGEAGRGQIAKGPVVHAKEVRLHQKGSGEALKVFKQRRKVKILKAICQHAEQAWMGEGEGAIRRSLQWSRQEMMAVGGWGSGGEGERRASEGRVC